jgi:hypothetical protein
VSKRASWEEWDDVLGSLDPETDTELYEVAVDRAMTLEIGLAARCHVAHDQAIHATVTALTGTSMSSGVSTSKLIGRIEAPSPKRLFPDTPPMRRHGRRYRRRALPINIGTVCSAITG